MASKDKGGNKKSPAKNNKTTKPKEVTSKEIEMTQVLAIPHQAASLDIFEKKYLLRDAKGNPVEQGIDGTYDRVASALAEVETQNKSKWKKEFLWAMKNGAIPAGRVMSNAGAQKYKPATSTINCTVSSTIPDDMEGIYDKLKDAAKTLKAGCGIGYEFSTLRPRGAFVHGAGATTSGPVSFMDSYDAMCFTVSSAGGRRGAQMGTFDIRHPDAEEFIKAKREDGRLRQFNMSLLITDEFVQAVLNDEDWIFRFPTNKKEVEALELDVNDPNQVMWDDWHVDMDGYIKNDEGKYLFRIYRVIKASALWNLIMSSTYDYAEPGFILIDEVNRKNNNWFCEEIRATNPCGEQNLPPEGSCLLGSVNLTLFVLDPFTPAARFDWERYKKVVNIFSRMLDNVVEINGLPLEGQRREIMRKRRHGMGFLGLGSTMVMLGMTYGSEKSIEFTENVSKELALEGYKAALDLAKEKGAAPIMDEKFEFTAKMARKKPFLLEAPFNYKIGDKKTGKELLVQGSEYMAMVCASLGEEWTNEAIKYGLRYTHHSSIAPTGTISLSLANNVSNGIEPSFSHLYSRNIIREGKKSKEKVDVCSFELLAYRNLVNKKAEPFAEDQKNQLPEEFMKSTSDAIHPRDHVLVQAASQKWIDSSISKTANVPTDFPFEEFKDIYLLAYRSKLKGCTTFRFNPENFQGVLVNEKDLENTFYEFTLDDGSTVRLKGNEEVEYDGETHTAANLYDALKEGYYGKF